MHLVLQDKTNSHKRNYSAIILTKNLTLSGAPLDQNGLRLF